MCYLLYKTLPHRYAPETRNTCRRLSSKRLLGLQFLMSCKTDGSGIILLLQGRASMGQSHRFCCLLHKANSTELKGFDCTSKSVTEFPVRMVSGISASTVSEMMPKISSSEFDQVETHLTPADKRPRLAELVSEDANVPIPKLNKTD